MRPGGVWGDIGCSELGFRGDIPPSWAHKGADGGLRVGGGSQKTFVFIHENMQHLEESAEEPPHTYLYLIWKVPSRELFAARRCLAPGIVNECGRNWESGTSAKERFVREKAEKVRMAERERAFGCSAALPAASRRPPLPCPFPFQLPYPYPYPCQWAQP